MTKLLEQAISQARDLPSEQQDVLATVMMSIVSGDMAIPALDDQARSAIREGLAQARRGESAPEEEIAAIWKRYGA